jgi:uncharacterized membrane protein YraQ (UPF0718 family)/copper chaperone CopZ
MVELSPSLFLGLFLAGLLHVYLPPGLVQRRLSRSNFASVVNASLIGVPMPLCSCGVVPTAIGLRNEGASKGAATSFLISTPQTGVDSILVSASFLGWPFALFKVVAAFVTGLLGGSLVNAVEGKQAEDGKPPMLAVPMGGTKNRLLESARYALFDLLAMIDIWIVVGVLASALITVLIPAGSLTQMEWLQGIGGMLVVLAVALPLYVCTTGSVPIAASLIAAGMPLGSALVFLMAGPATNVATMGAVFRAFGGRVLLIYLSVVALMSIAFGLLFDWILGSPAGSAHAGHVHGQGHAWFEHLAAAAMSLMLIGLLVRRLVRSFVNRARRSDATAKESGMELKVEGMTCQHCVANVKKALEDLEGVKTAEPDLDSGQVQIEGEGLAREDLVAAVVQAGYKAS